MNSNRLWLAAQNSPLSFSVSHSWVSRSHVWPTPWSHTTHHLPPSLPPSSPQLLCPGSPDQQREFQTHHKQRKAVLSPAGFAVGTPGRSEKQSGGKSWNMALCVSARGAPGLSTRHSHGEPRLLSTASMSVLWSATKSYCCAHRLLLPGSGRTSEGGITRLPLKGKSPLLPPKSPLISKTENLMILWRCENASQRRVPS